MAKLPAIHERPETSVKSIGVHLEKPSLDDRMRLLMLQDFCSKASELTPTAYYLHLSKVLKTFAPKTAQDLLATAMNRTTQSPSKIADVGIVTIIPEELNAVKIALAIDPDDEADHYSNGLRFWERVLTQPKTGHEIRVVVTMVGEARTVPCAVSCSRFFRVYDVGCCLLVGIAAGLKSKVGLGHVIVSDAVLDYEGQRLDATGPKKRPQAYEPELRVRRDFQYFSSSKLEWQKAFAAGCKHLKKQKRRMPTLSRSWKPDFDSGVIVAGEKLIDDGSLPEMREQFHDKVRAGEMEGSGFARACIEYGIPWLVFRGISDFGDESGTRTRKLWKATAALSAGTAATVFLKFGFKQGKEEKF